MNTLSIAIDFDNTIVDYSNIFYISALERKLIPSNFNKDKTAIRDYIRQKDGNNAWIGLQAYVYGYAIIDANIFAGFYNFIKFCNKKHIELSIVSHKTKFPPSSYKQYNFHEKAKEWLQKNKILDYISLNNIFFLATRKLKLEKISDLNCSLFIDDLPEVLESALFPSSTSKVLFDPHNTYPISLEYEKVDSWKMINSIIKK